MTVGLDHQQKQHINAQIQPFLAYLKTEAARKDEEERLRRTHYFQHELPEKLESLSEADVAEMVSQLWASRIWGNKQYLVQKVIEDNGLDSLKDELRHLLNRTVSPRARYERALTRIRRLGPASVTEILCYSDPGNCGIWNERSRAAIRKLGLGGFVSPEKYSLTAAEYSTFNDLLAAIGRELETAGVSDVDLLKVDFFLYVSAEETPPSPPESFDHDEIRDLIESIGAMLGFDAQTEVVVAHGAKVDVVWRARIGNLGTVTYVFEVHKSGSIDSLVLNLQKAKSGPTVQKVIAVSSQEQLGKIEAETDGLPEEFKRALAFWRVAEVQEVGKHLSLATESINRLGLVPGT